MLILADKLHKNCLFGLSL